MRETQRNNDPYAPPPRHRDKSGAIVRVAILAALLAGATWGYVSFQNSPQTASLAPTAEEQDYADARGAGYRVETPVARTPTMAPAPARVESTPAEAAPPPPTTAIEPSSAQTAGDPEHPGD